MKGSSAVAVQWDTIIATAAVGNAKYGVDKASTETWSSYTDRNAVSHVIAATGGVANVADLLKIRRIFAACNITNNLFAWVSPQFMEKFLNITEVKSSDFNVTKTLVDGNLGHYMGFDFVVSNTLPLSSTTRSCIFGQKGVMGLGRSITKKVRVGERSDLSYADQIYLEICGGSVRRDPERIVEYQITES
jgi:hypothetical protein